MKFRQLCITLSLAFGLCTSFVPSLPSFAADQHVSFVNGSFIQPWLYAGWDDARWEAEIAVLKETGIDTLIMGDVANQNPDDSWTVFYPSELDFLQGYFAYNAVDSLFYYCDKYDIKVYLGMGLDTAWDSDLTNPDSLAATKAYMDRCNQITTELYNTYKHQYPDTYCGFYFVTELFNTHYMETDEGIDSYTDGLAEMFGSVIENCHSLDPSMPISFSPYVNIFGYGFSCIDRDRFTEYWTAALIKIPFRDGDAIIPQDSCGGGGNDPAHLGEWMAAYRDAVDRSNAARGTKLLLGTNAEIFVSPDASRMSSPHGVSYVGTKTVDDFAKRLEITAPYTDLLYCFAYSHHYSPYNAPTGFHEGFVRYLQTGEMESNPPTPPETIRTMLVSSEGADHLQLTISGMSDDLAVGQINIYKNGRFYDYLVPAAGKVQDTWIDYEFDPASDTAIYEFEVFDVCGNVSESRTGYTVTPANVNNGIDPESGVVNMEPERDWNKTALDYLSYTVTDSGVRITGCDPEAETLVIPDQIEGVPVTIIDWYAFENCSRLQSVTLPDTVTHISRFAFVHCISLREINMPASLYAIEQYAFHDCPLLETVELPEGLAIIEKRAFSECDALKSVTIPASCSQIGDYAFFDCVNLREASVLHDNAVIGERAFGYVYDSGYAVDAGYLIDAADGSTAEAYAIENGIALKSHVLYGDVNLDGEVTMLDAVLLQQYLLKRTTLNDAQLLHADLHGDGKVNAFDLGMLKRKLLQT